MAGGGGRLDRSHYVANTAQRVSCFNLLNAGVTGICHSNTRKHFSLSIVVLQTLIIYMQYHKINVAKSLSPLDKLCLCPHTAFQGQEEPVEKNGAHFPNSLL